MHVRCTCKHTCALLHFWISWQNLSQVYITYRVPRVSRFGYVNVLNNGKPYTQKVCPGVYTLAKVNLLFWDNFIFKNMFVLLEILKRCTSFSKNIAIFKTYYFFPKKCIFFRLTFTFRISKVVWSPSNSTIFYVLLKYVYKNLVSTIFFKDFLF